MPRLHHQLNVNLGEAQALAVINEEYTWPIWLWFKILDKPLVEEAIDTALLKIS